jgi:hypothetical protein
MSERMLKQKVKQLFPDEMAEEVFRILDGYSGPERERVQLAVLKCAGTDHEKVREGIELASQDYRDILAFTEYPRQMAIPPNSFLAMSPGEKQVLLQADRDEYHSWLEGGPLSDEPS